VIVDNSDEVERIGVKVGTIGSHSVRKGAATLAASGCTASPSMSLICNRAGWKMGEQGISILSTSWQATSSLGGHCVV
jgi:hypothetical protein